MMRIVQSIAPAAIGSEYCDEPVGMRYAAFEGLVYDLGLVQECLSRISDMLDGTKPRDDLALAAYTWQAVILYARCFDQSSEGRRGALGDRAVRTLSRDEETLHNGLLNVRNDRFAHAGKDANHRCVIALFEHNGQCSLRPGFEIETPTGMFDDEQVRLMQSIIRKVQASASEALAEARHALEQQLANPGLAEPICERLRATRKQATPEATVISWIMRGFGN